MAEIADVSTVIASALAEVSLSGSLDLKMDGMRKTATFGAVSGEQLEVSVIVKSPAD